MLFNLADSTKGCLVARLLAGAWRANPEALRILPEEIGLIAPLLLSTGGASLAWRRIESLDMPPVQFILKLQDGYRKHMLEAAVHQIDIKDIFKRMRAAGIEPLLFKGWALARLYPDVGLRPYGDIDL